MIKQKKRLRKRVALVLFLTLSPFLLLAGCKLGKDLPFYQFEDDKTSVLTVDGVRYIEDADMIRNRTNATGLFWIFTGKLGETIGVCGGDNAESGGGFDVRRIEGDEEQNFLYVCQNYFAPGLYHIYFCAREDLQMRPPSVETVSSVTIVYYNDKENTSAQVDNSAMIPALFEVFNGDRIQTLNGEDWVYGALIMYHKDFPFLQCKIEYCYSPEQEISYCQNEKCDWLLLPVEWYAVISEHDFPTRGE